MRNIVLSILFFLIFVQLARGVNASETDGGDLITEPEATPIVVPPPAREQLRTFMILLSTEWDDGSGDYPHSTAYMKTVTALPPEVREFVITWQLDVFPKAFRRQGKPGTWLAKSGNMTFGPVTATACFLDEFLAMLDTRYGRRDGNVYLVYSRLGLYDLEALMKSHPELRACTGKNDTTALRARNFIVVTQGEDAHALMAVEQTLDMLRTHNLVCAGGSPEPWCNLTVYPWRLFQPPILRGVYHKLLVMPSRKFGRVILVRLSHQDSDKPMISYEELSDAEAVAHIRASIQLVRMENSVVERFRQFGIAPKSGSCEDEWRGGECRPDSPWTVEVIFRSP